MTTAKTIYPSLGDYNLSVTHLTKFAREPRLMKAQPQQMTNGNLVAYSGGYSRVYPVRSGGGVYALRCWTADVGDARVRYREISGYLARQSLPYFVEFEYLENALVVKGQHYPVLWMEWAEGPRLRDFVGQNLGRKDVLRSLAEAFREMVTSLHSTGISHGDLQDENIIVQPGPSGPRLRLIDYDSLYVPTLQGYSDQIIGVSNYQHPRRNTLRAASDRVDYFSELVIYLSLLVYAENSGLWNAKAEKQLLFADTDFVDPVRSGAFQALRYMTGEVRVLTDRLVDYCRESDLLRLEPLEIVTAGMGGGGASGPTASGPKTGLPSGFLATPAPAPPSAAAPRRPALEDDFVSTPAPAGTGAASPRASTTGVPGDFLSVPPVQPPPASPAPPSLPDNFLDAPKASLPYVTLASAGSRPHTGNWDAFFEGAGRTARPPSRATVRTAPPPAPAPAIGVAPLPAPSLPVRAIVAKRSPARSSTPPPVRTGVDWPTVWKGFVVGLVLGAVVLLLLWMLRGGTLLAEENRPDAARHGEHTVLGDRTGAAWAT